MRHSIHASILRHGDVVRCCARAATVARFLVTVQPLAAYQVVYWDRAAQQHRHVTGATFLELVQAGHFAPASER
jgi:hypothetical protein